MENSKGKHLTIIDRTTIEYMLKQDCTCLQIAQEIGKDPSTISKEIKRNRIETKANISFDSDDRRLHLPLCARQKRFPHVCNGCSSAKRRRCRKSKHTYNAKNAQRQYEDILVDSRIGVNLTIDEVTSIDNFITPLILNGQSLYHIMQSNLDSIPISERTLYRYVENNVLTAINLDLPKKVVYKPRKNKKEVSRIRKSKENHLYIDYLNYLKENYIYDPVQIDVVEGLKADKNCLLTIQFTKSKLMLIRLLNNQTKQEVVDQFNQLEKQLESTEEFYKLFECSLTDNGSEFNDVTGLEFNTDTGERRMNLFYCNSMSPFEKGALEKNHVHIRSILPKGTSFKNLTVESVKLMESHINSYIRKSLDNKTPYDVFEHIHGANLTSKLTLTKVNSNEVILKPKLLK